jgi:hypothetical protein
VIQMNALMLSFLLFAGAFVHASDGLVLRIRQVRSDIRTIQACSSFRTVGCYFDGKHIPIQLEIANKGDETKFIHIVDHDNEGHRLQYPDGLEIRVVDANGQVLTAHDMSSDERRKEWWSRQYIGSRHPMMSGHDLPGNRIELKTGAHVRRVYDITEVAGGCSSCPFYLYEFPPGKYFIELRLNGLRSNQYEIIVLRDGETCK